MKRDGATESLWQSGIKSVSSALPAGELFDVVVIGGGITGLSTALRLQRKGKKTLLLEAANIGFGSTGGTTAHLNTFFDATYDQVINDFGEKNALLLAQAGK